MSVYFVEARHLLGIDVFPAWIEPKFHVIGWTVEKKTRKETKESQNKTPFIQYCFNLHVSHRSKDRVIGFRITVANYFKRGVYRIDRSKKAGPSRMFEGGM